VLTNPADIASFCSTHESGSQTGIAISFDTWAGNTFPDGESDVEGLSVRVDGKTVKAVPLPTRHGECEDDTSLQTGPRNPDYWVDGGDPYDSESWSQLCWQPLRVVVTTQGKVSVYWKGNPILENEPTGFFPSAGQIMLACRTGGANSNVHFDNLRLLTPACGIGCFGDSPTWDDDPPFLNVVEVGAARVALEWGEATNHPDPSFPVGYEVERNGTVLPGIKTDTTMEDGGVMPETSYNYLVRATDVRGNKSPWVAAAPVTTAAEVPAKGFVKGVIYDGIVGAMPIQEALNHPIYSSGKSSRGIYLPSLAFNDLGDHYLMDIEGTVTPATSGLYRFFLRSDDASELFLNADGSTTPAPTQDFSIVAETDRCDAFQEPGVPNDDGMTYPTSEPVSLQAGQAYGFRFLVKDGGCRDWGQVAWRMEGDSTPAEELEPIQGTALGGFADSIGATLTVTKEPQSQLAIANERAEFTVVVDYATPYDVTPVYQWFKDGALISTTTARRSIASSMRTTCGPEELG
jgi:hypothetical protein